ncbi:TdeIII family type II restriction endonuclease [Helicobacter sp. MIT 00-7814]|uniref:TdeIII family type II restriction endonuclease n=1 Tax=unclassified Helicobacter TaxID=2593540 RepID=UPI000E1EAE60|nr:MULTISPECIES: TdeIII family type II restriction endonuclease [unclassified Helicobacter]RDU52632.1 TdeIII family type II restriction endonuclease [Helicobacter sp. MIT 00-7814]RDU55911.1 TdeIII family type II restriction endonuclease [Helicobacter sp. MIT 99-10781]
MIKQKIKDRLKLALRQKFESYNPETSFMPFHTRLLGKDRMALYSFIQNLNTNFNTSIFEPIAQELASNKFDEIKRQSNAGGIITKQATRVIQDIMNSLESGASKPDKCKEIARILEVAKSGETSKIKPSKVDLFLRKDNNVYLIDIKTAKPNKRGFKEFKRTLLTWIASYAYANDNVSIHSLIAIPYNPYEPKPYERWTMAGMLDLEQELKVADEFWNFLSQDESYHMLLRAFEEVGIEMRDEIDSYFKKFQI